MATECGDEAVVMPKASTSSRRMNEELSLATVNAAAEKLKTALAHIPTGLTRSAALSELLGMEVYIKREFEHVTGSFKERGVCNALMRMPAREGDAEAGSKSRGTVAASAGNHALALSYYGHKLGVPVTVVMPEVVPHGKVDRCQAYGARVLVKGKHYGDSVDEALKLAQSDNLHYIDDYDNVHVVSGAGTMALEIMQQAADAGFRPDAIVVPVGGAGLLAGVAVAAKGTDPNVKIIAAEPAAAPSMHAAIENNGPVTVAVQPTETLADVLVVPRVGEKAFFACRRLVDSCVVVQEDWIRLAMYLLHKHEGVRVEGAGATALAALLAGLCNELKFHKVVIIASGGNISEQAFQAALTEGEQLEKSLLSSRKSGQENS